VDSKPNKNLVTIGETFLRYYSPSGFITLVDCFIAMNNDQFLEKLVKKQIHSFTTTVPELNSQNSKPLATAILKVSDRLGWGLLEPLFIQVSFMFCFLFFCFFCVK
jgi:hypothetical protein